MAEKFNVEFPDDKMIIVSQWTYMLSLIGSFITKKDIKFFEIKNITNYTEKTKDLRIDGPISTHQTEHPKHNPHKKSNPAIETKPTQPNTNE